MLIHFIPHKGKGFAVIAVPMVVALVLFMVFSVLEINDKYIGCISLISSAFIIWFFDGGPAALRDGLKINPQKAKHTLFWIEIKYWGIVLGIIGCVWLGNLLNNGGNI